LDGRSKRGRKRGPGHKKYSSSDPSFMSCPSYNGDHKNTSIRCSHSPAILNSEDRCSYRRGADLLYQSNETSSADILGGLRGKLFSMRGSGR